MSNITEKLKALDKGQKSKVGIIVIALIVIVYMLVDMMGETSISQNSIRTAETISDAAPNRTISTSKQNEQIQEAVTELQTSSVLPLEEKEVVLPKKTKRSQSHYLESMDQLKQLELTQKIENLKQSIAKSKLMQLQTEQEIDLLMSPPALPPESEVIVVKEPETVSSNPQVEKAREDYKLLYVANEENSWQAVLGLNGKFYTVSIGTTLPDGRTVVAITSTTVMLDNGETKQLLSMTPVI